MASASRTGTQASRPTLFTSRTMAQARAVFLDEACWLGAERGRGTYVGRSQAVGTEDWAPAQVVAAYERGSSATTER